MEGRYYDVRTSCSEKVPISTAGMFPTWDLRSNYESAYAIGHRHSVPEVTKFLPFHRTTERDVLWNEQHALRTMRTMHENNNQPKSQL